VTAQLRRLDTRIAVVAVRTAQLRQLGSPGRSDARPPPARYDGPADLLGELGVRGDIAFLATALLAALEVPILVQHMEIEEMRPGASSGPGTTWYAAWSPDSQRAASTVTGTPFSAAFPDRSSRVGSVRSLIDTPATLLALRILVPSTWCP